jgi:hypothetical protein
MQLLEQATTKNEKNNDDVSHPVKPHHNLKMVWVQECNEGHCKLTAQWVIE